MYDWLVKQLYKAFLEARRHKLGTKDEHIFELNAMENVIRLTEEILAQEYEPSNGIAFISFDPVYREVFAAPFRDRVVHHFLYNMQAPWWDRRFIHNSFSCREAKGTLFGVERLQGDMMRAIQKYPGEKIYVQKLDIKGYFMSMRRKKLFRKVVWGLDRQFMPDACGERGEIYKVCRFLWRKIIFDDPVSGVRLRGRIADWELLDPSKSLGNQPAGQGIVIGNLTSQLLSNIFLDSLDRYVTINLGYKFYGRYVDDFYIVIPESQRERLKTDVRMIERFLLERMGLTLHPKKRYFQEVNKGVEFLGFRIRPYFITPGVRLKRNFRKAVVRYATGQKVDDGIIQSYLGLFEHCNSHKLIDCVFESVGWEYVA